MNDPTRNSAEVTDSRKQEFGFGEGGVPWFLLLGYLAFLVFFTWYTLTFQLADFEQQGPFPVGGSETTQDVR